MKERKKILIYITEKARVLQVWLQAWLDPGADMLL